ncbi:MAG: hypothetical protein K2O14_07010 [Oscillospiraceae bacterium]|nr:hypothetical protein [Oscillospiraceae bacterium]
MITEKNYKNCAVGAKAANLFIMREHGINIPPFFCAFGEDIGELEAFAENFFGEGERVSVRSSASAEDGKSTSFAGQFRTELDLPISGIKAAAERVCAVPQTAGFAEYCKINDVGSDKIRVCAIVQKMVPAEFSGVIFTANPQGLLNESVVVIGRGTGDNIVEDKADTTSYFFNNSDGLYYSEQSGDSPLIPEETLKELIGQAGRIKDIFGAENEYDIEFAIKDGEIFILQARPITTLERAELPIILDNSNIVESYPGITLPLTQSFIREAYYRVFRSVLLRLTREPKTVGEADEILRNMVDAANGRIYYRISNWYDVILFLPFSKKIIPVWQEMLGVKNKNVTSHLAKKIGFVTHAKVTLSFIRLILACPRLMEKLDGEFKEMIALFRSVDLNKASGAEILVHYKNVLERVTEKWDLTLVNDMYSFIFTGLLKSRLKAKKIPEAAAEANRLISGLNGIESMKPVNELIKIAELAEESGELPRLKRIESAEDYRAYSKSGGAAAVRIAEYIELYGDRNAEELKLESRTFRTDPQLLIRKIVQYAEGGITAEEKRNGASKPPRGLCGAFAKRAAVGIKNREKSRLNRSRLYGMMRAMMLKIGGELAAAKHISEPRDIFYLEYGEIERCVKSGGNMQSLIAERRALYGRFERLPAYSRLIFADKVFDKAPKNVGGMTGGSAADILEGTPCSGGTARGEVLVVDDPSSCPDAAGKILVAKMTDPGWVFLIVGAAGIVAEKGSLLSHTAIISRELGKPAVVGVEGAARLLKNGDIVEIDGIKGKITVIGRSKP